MFEIVCVDSLVVVVVFVNVMSILIGSDELLSLFMFYICAYDGVMKCKYLFVLW